MTAECNRLIRGQVLSGMKPVSHMAALGIPSVKGSLSNISCALLVFITDSVYIISAVSTLSS
jgi:hypothetical protein